MAGSTRSPGLLACGRLGPLDRHLGEPRAAVYEVRAAIQSIRSGVALRASGAGRVVPSEAVVPSRLGAGRDKLRARLQRWWWPPALLDRKTLLR